MAYQRRPQAIGRPPTTPKYREHRTVDDEVKSIILGERANYYYYRGCAGTKVYAYTHRRALTSSICSLFRSLTAVAATNLSHPPRVSNRAIEVFSLATTRGIAPVRHGQTRHRAISVIAAWPLPQPRRLTSICRVAKPSPPFRKSAPRVDRLLTRLAKDKMRQYLM